MSKPRRAQIRRPTLRESLLALVAGALVALGPLTPAAWGPSIAAGVIAAAFALWWQTARRPARAPRASGAAAPAPRWQVPTSVWLCGALFAAACAPTFAWMYSEWTGGVWHNTHGLLIPVLMVLLARNILRRMPAGEDAPSGWGWLPLLAGLALLVMDAAIHTRYLSALGIVVCLPGLSLLLLGPARTRALALPLTLGLFMIPLPNAFASQMYLRTFTAEVTAPLLTAMGIPTLVDHTLLELPNASFLVANSCSGFSTLYSALAMGILLGTLCPSLRRRWLVYASIVPLALAANVARVIVLVLLALYVDPSLLETSAHAASGVATFFVVLAVLIGLADRPPLAQALL